MKIVIRTDAIQTDIIKTDIIQPETFRPYSIWTETIWTYSIWTKKLFSKIFEFHFDLSEAWMTMKQKGRRTPNPKTMMEASL